MNEHTGWQEALAHYRDLEPQERRALDAHLAGCESCRDLLASYERQDRALSAIPLLRPRGRVWRLERAGAGWVGRLGQGLALAGMAALLGVMALQVQYAVELAAAGEGGTPAAPPITEPGIVLPPATVDAPSGWLGALPWIGLALLVVGGLFVLGRQRRGPVTVGAALSAALLISFVPPLSAVPNPAGLIWRLVGGYSYDPALPFKNDFLIAGQPDQFLRPFLDTLLGEVGLSPLDPLLPLARYEILRVGVHPNHNRVVLVTVRFIYSDGSSRIYPVPVTDTGFDRGGFWLDGWRQDGVQRLRSEHRALRGQPFAGPDSPIRLGPAAPITSLAPAANRLDEVNPSHWLWDSVRVQRLVWAPDGQSFLASMETDTAEKQLWEVLLDGSPPQLLASGDIYEYGWSPDGKSVVLTRFDSAASQLDPFRPFAIVSIPRDGRTPGAIQLATRLPSSQLPGLTANGAWFFSDGSLWIAPYSGGQPRLVMTGGEAAQATGEPRPSPDGQIAAFACGDALCLADVSDGQAAVTRVPDLLPSEMAWSHDGTKLAVVDRDPNSIRAVRLVVVTSDGLVAHSGSIAPLDVTDSPQWTPDGEAVFIQTYPNSGRRIIAVDLVSGETLDLSQEHWDAYFALAPDGQSLLLNNGRGNFWTAPVIRSR